MSAPITVVLDDDPTGIQTVHDVPVYTDWSEQTLVQAFGAGDLLFFILTNSRSFAPEQTKTVHQQIGQNLLRASQATGRSFTLVSRGDSTLRGHYPLEMETLKQALESEGTMSFDGEILVPCFMEGGRITQDDVHYVIQGGEKIPAGETEFANDKSFGFHASNLTKWIEEKSAGKISASEVVSLNPAKHSVQDMAKALYSARNYRHFVLNAASYDELQKGVDAFVTARQRGKNFLVRSAASWVKVLGGISDRPLLTREELVEDGSTNGGLIIVGSHVNKTSLQLAELQKRNDIEFLEFNVRRVLEENGLLMETKRVVERVEAFISEGKTVAVYTSRQRIDASSVKGFDNLRMSVAISQAITDVVGHLHVRPAYILAKGGITSSDIGTKALRVRKAWVKGQIAKGVPVWQTGDESLFPRIPYIIFPGNVGEADTLAQVVGVLQGTAS